MLNVLSQKYSPEETGTSELLTYLLKNGLKQ